VKRLFFVGILALVSSLVTLAACKQGQGERCQIDDDCDSMLVCNKAKNTCQSTDGDELDASVIDAAPADAPPDALNDAL
jgi:hypothetical protein